MNKEKFRLPPISNYLSRRAWEEVCWQKISRFGKLLGLLVTPNERHNLVMRAAVIDRLKSGKRYRDIGEGLWLSPQTISSIKKALRENSYRSYRERGKTERKRKIYSRHPSQKKRKPHGRPVRTKYGIVYLPY